MHVVDSSGLTLADLNLPDHLTGLVDVTQTSFTNPHSKLAVVLDKLDEKMVLLASNDDLYCFSDSDISRLAESSSDCAFPRWLMIRDIPKHRGLLRLWEGWTHFGEAASEDRSGRVAMFAGEGLNAFYGLYKSSVFKELISWQKRLFRWLDESQWSIVENLVNLATLALSWEPVSDSWCFRKLDRRYGQNKNWRPPWFVFEELAKTGHLLSLEASLDDWLIRKLNQSTYGSNPRQLLADSVRGYQEARSRIWHSGHDFILLPESADGGIAVAQIFDDQRFGYVVGSNLGGVTRIAGGDSWVSSPNAVRSFQLIPSGYFLIDKAFEIEA